MIRLYLKRTVLLAVAAASAYALAIGIGPLPAFLTSATLAAVASIAGAAMLRTSELGRVTWRNRLTGYLIPWGWRLNRGKLWPITLISWVVWMAVCGAAVLLHTSEDSLGLRSALLAAWLIDAAALMYLLGTISQATPGSRVGSLWNLVAFIVGVIVASLALYLSGYTTVALIVGGGPPALIGLGFGLVLLIFATLGRNTRWN